MSILTGCPGSPGRPAGLRAQGDRFRGAEGLSTAESGNRMRGRGARESGRYLSQRQAISCLVACTRLWSGVGVWIRRSRCGARSTTRHRQYQGRRRGTASLRICPLRPGTPARPRRAFIPERPRPWRCPKSRQNQTQGVVHQRPNSTLQNLGAPASMLATRLLPPACGAKAASGVLRPDKSPDQNRRYAIALLEVRCDLPCRHGQHP